MFGEINLVNSARKSGEFKLPINVKPKFQFRIYLMKNINWEEQKFYLGKSCFQFWFLKTSSGRTLNGQTKNKEFETE